MQKDMQKKDRRFRSRKNGHFTVAGSVTVEAALVLPLFIFFSFMLFSVFDMISTYCRFQSALTETAAEAAVLLYAKEDSMPDKEESFLLAETFIREEITRKTAKTLGGSVVEWDALGLHLFRSDMADESGNVRLILTYVVKPWFSIGGVGRMTMANHVTVHAWTGYEKPEEKEESDEEEQMVYVTKTGNAYHLFRDCLFMFGCTTGFRRGFRNSEKRRRIEVLSMREMQQKCEGKRRRSILHNPLGKPVSCGFLV